LKRVVAEDPGVALEGACHVTPDPVVLALQITRGRCWPRSGERRCPQPWWCIRGTSDQEGSVRGTAVGAQQAPRGALAVETSGLYTSLMHVRMGVDVKAAEQVDGLGQAAAT